MDFINVGFVLLKYSRVETSEMPKSLKGHKNKICLVNEPDRFIIVLLIIVLCRRLKIL